TGGYSFQDVHPDFSKGRQTVVFSSDAGRGARFSGVPRSCPRLQAPAMKFLFLQGLNICLHRRVKTGFDSRLANGRRAANGSNLDTPRPQGSGGQAFQIVVLPDPSLVPCVSRIKVSGRTVGATRRSGPWAFRPPTGESLLWKERQNRTRSRS